MLADSFRGLATKGQTQQVENSTRTPNFQGNIKYDFFTVETLGNNGLQFLGMKTYFFALIGLFAGMDARVFLHSTAGREHLRAVAASVRPFT